MTIQNAVAYVAGVWDWAILRGCFGETRIEPTDVDGFVERNGRFLYLEAKQPGVSIPHGQRLTIQALQKTGLFTVMVIWGPTNQPQHIQVFSPTGTSPIMTCDLPLFRRAVNTWFRQVDAGKPVRFHHIFAYRLTLLGKEPPNDE